MFHTALSCRRGRERRRAAQRITPQELERKRALQLLKARRRALELGRAQKRASELVREKSYTQDSRIEAEDSSSSELSELSGFSEPSESSGGSRSRNLTSSSSSALVASQASHLPANTATPKSEASLPNHSSLPKSKGSPSASSFRSILRPPDHPGPSASRSSNLIRPSSSAVVASPASCILRNTAAPKTQVALQHYFSLPKSKRSPLAPTPLPSKMPAYRAGGRRQNRTGYVDHDILEGIPVRQWRREFVTVAPPPPQENNASQNDIWANELPWGMPKDSHLLPQHSQDLLRAARSGRIYKRPAPMDEEEQDVEVNLEKPDKKEEETKDSGFTARAWKQIPGHQNASDMDFLAKRRKGLVSAVPKPAPVPTVVQTTVRRTDAAGNEYLEKIIVPHGQTVVGEVVSQTTIPDPSAAEGTPFRRKGPGGKKGKRGPGRGRKKILPTSTPQITSEPAIQNSNASTSNLGTDGIKIEGEGSSTPTKNLDTEMIDDSNPASDDDDGDDGDQGDDDDDSFDALNSPSKPHRESSHDHPMPTMNDIPHLSNTDITMGGTDNHGTSNSELETVKDEGKFGSPLKQIASTTSTANTPMVSPIGTITREPISFQQGSTNILSDPIERVNQELLSIAEVSTPIDLPPVPPHPTQEHEEVSVELRAEEEEEEEETIFEILENANNAHIRAAIPLEIEDPALAAPASIASPEKAFDPPAAEEKSRQTAPVPSPLPFEVPIEEPSAVTNLATDSPHSPMKEEQSVVLASPPAEVPQSVEHVEPIELDKPVEPAEPSQSAEHNTSTELTELKDRTAPSPSESNKQNGPFEPTDPIIEEDDDDFPDLLGGLERNLYGDSLPPVTQSASVLKLEAEPIHLTLVGESNPSPKEAEGNANAADGEKHEEIEEETSMSTS